MLESKNACELCNDLMLPIEECHRLDVSQRYIEVGMDLYCEYCGRFWKGSKEELENALENLKK